MAPTFALTGLLAPGAGALYGADSLKSALLIAGMSGCLASVALFFYRWRLPRLLLHITLLCMPIALFYRLVYGGSITPGLLLSVAETNSREAVELLGGHVLLVLVLIALAAGAICASILSWTAQNPFSARRCLVAACVSVAMILGSLAIAYAQAGRNAYLLDTVKEGVETSFPADLGYSLRVVLLGMRAGQRRAATVGSFSFSNVHRVGASSRRVPTEIYVIVVGEASRRANWSLYGYARSTTPRLDAIRPELVIFDKATANATITILSIAFAMTRPTAWDLASADRTGPAEKSIIALLREGGYTVDWISNQERFGRNANPISAIALEANSASFREQPSASADSSSSDSTLLIRLNDALGRLPENGKLVVFLHTMGSHYRYADRYPPAFAKFKAPDAAPRKLTQRQKQIVDEYDNSVYFTDYVLRETIDQLASRHCRAALLFFSDHGERLFDGGVDDDEIGHGFPSVSRQEIEIPFFLWLSPEFRQDSPQMVARLMANARYPIQLRNVFETIVDLTGLDYDGRDATASAFSAAYRPPRRLDVLNMSEKHVFLAPEGGVAETAASDN